MNFKRMDKMDLIWLVTASLVMAGMNWLASGFPFDQDSGFRAVLAENLIKGGHLYTDFFDHHPPGGVVLYAFIFKLFGISVSSLRWGSLCLDLLTLIFLFFIARQFLVKKIVYLSVLLYSLFGSGLVIQLQVLQDEHGITLFTTLAIFLAILYMKRTNSFLLFLSGVSLGIAMLFKQTAGAVVPCILIWFLYFSKGKRSFGRLFGDSILFLIGSSLPFMATIGYFFLVNRFDDFFSSVILYNLHYVATAKLHTVLRVKSVIPEQAFIFIISSASAIYLLLNQRQQESILMILWGVFSLLAVVMSGKFGDCYFIQMIPPLAVISGIGLFAFWDQLSEQAEWHRDIRNLLFLMIIIGAGLIFVIKEYRFRNYILSGVTSDAVAVKAGEYLTTRIVSGDSLYIWGSRPQIYFLCRAKPATRYLYNFRYTEKVEEGYFYSPEILKEIMGEVKRKQPEYIIVTELKSLKYFKELAKHLEVNYHLETEFEGYPYTISLFRINT
ncbi:MAG: glycosyltransferase family 39 protein [bacterium]